MKDIKVGHAPATVFLTETLYRKIIRDLIEQIKSGKLPVGSRIPTETELAKEYYVSRITSRRALNELALLGYVVRKRRVGTFVIRTDSSQPAARKDESTPDPGLVRVIGLIFPFTSNSYDGQEFLKGVLEVTDKHRYYTVVQNSLSNHRVERQIIERYTSDRLDGIIYYPINSESNFMTVANLRSTEYPIVTIDKTIDGVETSSVVSDNAIGCRESTRHLIESGHRSIAVFSDAGINISSSTRERFKGFLDALAENNIPFNPQHVFSPRQIVYEEPNYIPPDSMQRRISIYAQRLESFLHEGVTAVQCMSDSTAHRLLKACDSLGVRVPKDLSICGFDGLPEIGGVRFTTVEQNLHMIGKKAAELILEMIQNPSGPSRRFVVPVRLIKKESVRRLNTASFSEGGLP